jgi:hypothetical protein
MLSTALHTPTQAFSAIPYAGFQSSSPHVAVVRHRRHNWATTVRFHRHNRNLRNNSPHIDAAVCPVANFSVPLVPINLRENKVQTTRHGQSKGTPPTALTMVNGQWQCGRLPVGSGLLDYDKHSREK